MLLNKRLGTSRCTSETGRQSVAASSLLLVTKPVLAVEEPAKRKHLPIEEVLKELKRGLVEDQYYVTGKVPKAVFADDCVFSDPTQTTHGIAWYSKAVPTLFNPSPDKSRIDVIDIKARDSKTIDLKWRLAAQLNVPGLRYNFKPYTGSTVYTTNSDGLISQQKESWDIGIIDAFVSTFVPSYGAPPAPPIEELVRRNQNQS